MTKQRLGLMGLALILALTLLLPIGQAQAQTSGGDEFPYVGIVSDGKTACAGVALSDQALVTVASCFPKKTKQVWASFTLEAKPGKLPEGLRGTWIPYSGVAGGPNVGVVILDKPMSLNKVAVLPPLEDLGRQRPGSPVLVVSFRPQGWRLDRLALSTTWRRGDLAAGDTTAMLAPLSRREGNCRVLPGSPVLALGRPNLLGLVTGAAKDLCKADFSFSSLNTPAARQFLQEAIQDPEGLKARHD